MPAPARYGDRRYPRLGILYPFTFGGRGSDGYHGSGLVHVFQAYHTVETDDLLLDANKHPSGLPRPSEYIRWCLYLNEPTLRTSQRPYIYQ